MGASSNFTLKKIEKRIIVLLVLFVTIFLSLSARVVYLQAFESEKLEKYGKSQRIKKVQLQPQRGRILDRNGNELALSTSLKTVIANPYHIKDPRDTAQKISKILEMDEKELEEKLSRKSGFVYIARKIPANKANKIEELKLEGVSIDPEYMRVYPEGSLASQIIGFTDIDNKGISGIEMKYDSYLSGRIGERIFEKDAANRVIPSGINIYKPPVDGKNLMLTIDKYIQFKAEEALSAAVKKYGAKAGSVVVMNVKTGEILAMANVPQFNPNPPRTDSTWVYKNRTISDLYEPGSTMKLLIAAAALEDKIVSLNQKFYLRPTYRIGNKTIREAKRNEAKTYDVKDIVAYSSNIGMVTIGVKMGKYSIYNWIRKFSLTEKTGVELPGETSGYLEQPKNWSATTIGNVPIGQGIAVNALQLLRAVCAVSNDGVMVEPKIILDDNNTDRERVLSKETSKHMRNILQAVVSEGTGKSAQVENYTVAGKTGTAQKAKQNSRGYEEGKYIASFVGFAPASKPEIGVIVVVDEPTTIWGSVVAGPVFQDIVAFSLPYLGIRPDKKEVENNTRP